MTDASLRFLFVTCGYPPEKTAGAERGLERYANALAARGHSVSILTIHHDTSLSQSERTKTGVQIERQLRPLSLGPLWGITLRRQVDQYLKQNLSQFDIVIGNQVFLYSDLISRHCAENQKASAHLIVNAHEFSDFRVLEKERNGQNILRETARLSHVFVLSQQIASEAKEFGFTSEQILPYRYFYQSEVKNLKAPSDSKDLVYIGRLSRQKCVPELLSAFLTYASLHNKLRLVIIGDGDNREELLAMLRRSPHSDRVTLYPWSDNPEQYYQQARAIVSASQAEGLSNVMIESMAHGRPILWSDVSGVRDGLLDDTISQADIDQGAPLESPCGFIHRPHDQQAMVQAMTRLEDDRFADQLGEKSREHFEERFTEERCVNQFLDGVEKIISRGGSTK